MLLNDDELEFVVSAMLPYYTTDSTIRNAMRLLSKKIENEEEIREGEYVD